MECSPLSAPPPPGTSPFQLAILHLLPSFFYPTELCLDPYIPFHWSGTAASIPLVFCGNWCICRCILEVLHVQLSLRHLADPHLCIIKYFVDFSNTVISSHVYLYFFEENTGKFHFLWQFQLHSTVILVIATLLYNRSLILYMEMCNF